MNTEEKKERLRLHREFWDVIKNNRELFFKSENPLLLKMILMDKFLEENAIDLNVFSNCFVCNGESCCFCLVEFNCECGCKHSWYDLWFDSIYNKNTEDFNKYCDLVKNAPERENE